MLSKRTLLKSLLLMFVLAVSMTSAFASKARARSMVDRLIEEKRSGRPVDVRTLEAEQRRFESQVERLLRRQSGLTSAELNIASLRDFVSRFERDPSNLDAIAEIMKNMTARGNVVPAMQESTANLLAQVIKLSQRGELMISPKDILEIDRNWSVAEKDQFSDILVEARRITQDHPELSSNKALEQALKNRGLWEKFKRRCV